MRPSTHLLPYIAAAAGIGLLGLMDGAMKYASLAAGAYSATLLRSLVAAALIAPVWLVRRTHWPRGRVLRLHIERGCVSAFMALSWFYALTKLPIAEAMAISFVAPLIALYFSHALLGEQVSRNAIRASLLGLVGTFVIVGGRLGEAGLTRDLALGLASLLFSAVLYAYNFVVIRRQSQVADPVEVATFHTGVSGLVLLLGAPFLFAVPGQAAAAGILLAATLTIAGSMAVAWAYARAEAQALVPLEYSGFLWAAWIGWQFFDEAVTPAILLGAVMIVMGSWIAAPGKRTAKPAPEV